MRSLTASEFMHEEIDIRDIRVLPIRENVKRESVFKNKMRYCNVLFMYLSDKRKYTTENGNEFFLTPGDIMYVPQYSVYKFNITEGNPLDYAIAVNFTLRDASGEEVRIGYEPMIIVKDKLAHYQSQFLRALDADNGAKNQIMLLKSVVYRLVHELFSEHVNFEAGKSDYKEILPAIDEIESQPSRDTPIPELALMCGVSETKFRQLFSLYTGGLSPVQYRNRLRMEQVIRSLRTEQITVEAAAHEAGFRDMAHFYRLYKKYKDSRE